MIYVFLIEISMHTNYIILHLILLHFNPLVYHFIFTTCIKD